MAALTTGVTGHSKTLHGPQRLFYILYKLLIPTNLTGNNVFQSSKSTFHWRFLNTLLFKGEDNTKLLGHRVANSQDGSPGVFFQIHSVNGGS